MKQPPERLVNRGLSISSCCLLHQFSVIIQQWRKTTKAGYNNVGNTSPTNLAYFHQLQFSVVQSFLNLIRYLDRLVKRQIAT